MTSVDARHADLGLAAVPCPDEVLTQLHKGQCGHAVPGPKPPGFPAHLSDRSITADIGAAFCGASLHDALPTAREDVMRAQTPATSLHRRAFETINPGQVLVIHAASSPLAS